jgi:hypothetical protein
LQLFFEKICVPETSENKLLAFAADTQAPMLVEKLLLKPFRNREATKLLFENVLQQKPRAFFLLGDVVNLGYSARQWKPIDQYLTSLRHHHISTYGILGNHEVMGRPKEGQRMFQERFPDHKRTGYVVIEDAIAVVLVNSNFSSLSKKENEHQQKWYAETLQALDADTNIEFIITGCHHSPFTNSRIVSPSKEVEEIFVPAFLQSKKSQLFLSGHCHAFEHYKVGGKDFMVIGGGGGLRQPLRQGIGTLTDLAIEYKPMFHYITIKRSADHLHVTSLHLKKDFGGFETGLQLDIKKYTELASYIK